MPLRKSLPPLLIASLPFAAACFPKRPALKAAAPASAAPSPAQPSAAPVAEAVVERNDGTLSRCHVSFFAPRAAVTAAACLEGARVAQLPDATITTDLWRYPGGSVGDALAVVTFPAHYEHAYWPWAQSGEAAAGAWLWTGEAWTDWLAANGAPDANGKIRGAAAPKDGAAAPVGMPIVRDGGLVALAFPGPGGTWQATPAAGTAFAAWANCLAGKAGSDAPDEVAQACRPNLGVSRHASDSPGWQSL